MNTTFIENGIEVCRSYYLIAMDGIVPHTRCRDIDIITIGIQRFIRLKLRASGQTIWFDYFPDLYELLATPSLITYFVRRGVRQH